MRVDETVKRETIRVAMGTCVLTALMLAVYLIAGLFDYKVLLGGIWGTGFAVLNFFLLGLSVQKASERMNGVKLPDAPEDEEESDTEDGAKDLSGQVPEIKEAKKKMQRAYFLRMLLMLVVAVGAVKLPFIDSLSGILPLLFPRIVIFIIGLRTKAEA